MTKTLDPTCVTGFGDRLAAAITVSAIRWSSVSTRAGKNFPRFLRKAIRPTLAAQQHLWAVLPRDH